MEIVREHNLIGMTMHYARAGVRTSDTPLIHLSKKNKLCTSKTTGKQ